MYSQSLRSRNVKKNSLPLKEIPKQTSQPNTQHLKPTDLSIVKA